MTARAPKPETEAGYRTSALAVRVLEISANHARGSLTVGTIAAIILALTFAWYPTINRLKVDLSCVRGLPREADFSPARPGDLSAGADCTLTRGVLFFDKTETVHITADTALAYVESSEGVAEECPKCSRVTLRTREGTFYLGRFPASLDEATAASYELNDFLATPTQKRVHIAYGPGFDALPVVVWGAVACLLAASLVVRRFHKVVLKWDPVERYPTVERRRWPLRRKIEHVPNDKLVGVATSGKELLETHLRFASGRKISLFGRTAANPRVHEAAVARIERFLLEHEEASA